MAPAKLTIDPIVSKFREISDPYQRFFAVGDVHGCPEELSLLLDYLEKEERLGPTDLVVFIGDYIDRGPDSKGVVDRLLAFQQKFPQSVFLRGNHEDMLLGFLGFGGSLGESYLFNGGEEFLRSYQAEGLSTAEEFFTVLPKTHLSFYLNLESYVITPKFVFAHAGLNPRRDLRAQMDRDLFWIRDEFIHNIHRFERTVVFGHTPYENVLFHLPFKIGIDTGLVYGNKLSCVELALGETYQVARKGKQVTKGRR